MSKNETKIENVEISFINKPVARHAAKDLRIDLYEGKAIVLFLNGEPITYPLVEIVYIHCNGKLAYAAPFRQDPEWEREAELDDAAWHKWESRNED